MLPNSGSFSLRVDYGSDPRGSAYRLPPARLLTSHATRAAGTRPSLARVEPLRRPLAVTAGWADTSASESSCLHRGGHPTERAGSVVWACTPDPVDLSSPRWSPPLQRSAASALLLEGSHMPRGRGKIPLEFLTFVLIQNSLPSFTQTRGRSVRRRAYRLQIEKQQRTTKKKLSRNKILTIFILYLPWA